MATIKLNVFQCKKIVDNMYPVFLMVSHAGNVRSIQTGIKIPDIKYFEKEKIVGMDNAEELNKILEDVKKKSLLFIQGKDFFSSHCKDIKNALYDHLRGFDQYRMGYPIYLIGE